MSAPAAPKLREAMEALRDASNRYEADISMHGLGDAALNLLEAYDARAARKAAKRKARGERPVVIGGHEIRADATYSRDFLDQLRRAIDAAAVRDVARATDRAVMGDGGGAVGR